MFTDRGCTKSNFTVHKHVASADACCAICAALRNASSNPCRAFTFHPATGRCATAPVTAVVYGKGKVSGTFDDPPAPPTPPTPPSPAPTPTPPSPAPTPPTPPRPTTGPNIIFVLTDDQDVRLNSMSAMPYLRETVLPKAANLSNFFVHTPICCPSRSTLVTGRFVHNNKVRSASAGGCMRMNSSRVDNPAFWANSFVRALSVDHGYKVGVFGKLLNTMDSYGCNGAASMADGVDRMFVMCNAAFYNEKWADFRREPGTGTVTGSVRHTGNAPEDYTTSLVGNQSLAWIKEIVEGAKLENGGNGTHAPFFAYLGPHAPHLPSTPPPYDVDPAIADIPVPVGPMYGLLQPDKHDFYPDEPSINEADAAAIAKEHTNRLQSLVAVDDFIRVILEYLKGAGEMDNTVRSGEWGGRGGRGGAVRTDTPGGVRAMSVVEAEGGGPLRSNGGGWYAEASGSLAQYSSMKNDVPHLSPISNAAPPPHTHTHTTHTVLYLHVRSRLQPRAISSRLA